MEVKNCKGCKRLFSAMSDSTILCPQCIAALEDKFQQVKRYLEENPNSSINVVSEQNDVSVKQIKQWVREERLSFSDLSVGGIDCERCGSIIRTGRFCDQCKNKIAANLISALDKPQSVLPKRDTRDKDRMRFL